MGKNTKKIKHDFFDRSPDIVARDLMEKILCRKMKDYSGKNHILKSKIVETEAYFSEEDPASRASKSSDKKINKVHKMMKKSPGSILIYNVHMYNMLNFVCQEKGKAGAVLIRSLEPVNFSGRCSGPGLLTNCLKIDKSFNEKEKEKRLWVEYSNKKLQVKNEEIGTSFRIGVTKDLKEHYRFYIKGNKFVSK